LLYRPELPQVEEAGSAERSNMIGHSELTVKLDAKVDR